MAVSAPTKTLVALGRLLRPLDWSKNSFVLAGLLFGHKWNDLGKVQSVLLAFIAYCAVASSVYVFNDLRDRKQDAHHPKKKHRPIASGAVSPGLAVGWGLLLLGGGLFGAYLVSWAALALIAAYAVLNAAYTLKLKHVVILDVFIIASGFVLRILVGTVGVDIPPSPWILVCGLSISLFLGFCKRRAELGALANDPSKHRAVLDDYTERDLEQAITISASCAIVSYALYTIDTNTVKTHGTAWLIATVPFVIYGIMRYIHRLHVGKSGGRTATDFLKDPHLALTALGWIATTLWLLS